MKKIFRMALVFALAGATLMYTSCTKDYQEEINNLDSRVSSLQSDLSGKLSDLEGQVSSLKSSISSLESAYKAADESIKSDLSGVKSKVSNIEEAIKSLATKDELKSTKEALEKKIADDIKAAKTELLAKAEDLQNQINTLDAALKLKADADKVYTKDEVNALLAKYFTQEEVKALLDKKADKDAVFTKDEITAFLAEKADKNAVFTKDEVKDLLSKYYNQEEIDKMLKEYYTKTDIDGKFAGYYTKEQIDEFLAKYYSKDEIDAKLKDLKDASDKLNDLFELLSDELRSIVFLPDFYFAGIESTSFDFASFIGYTIVKTSKDTKFNYSNEGEDATAVATFKAKTPVDAQLLVTRDAAGNAIKYKFDPEAMDYVRDDDGKLVPAKSSDEYWLYFYPGNHTVGQIGKANYNLNPSTFAIADADWSLKGRNVKYVVKSEDETWAPVFLDIEKDDEGLATVYYKIANPEYLFSSIWGAFFMYNFDRLRAQEEQAYDSYAFVQAMKKWLLAWEYKWNNVPTMQLVGTLSDGRSIFSDWHAITSFEEVVDHLAFRSDNDWVAYDDCGLNDSDKDLYPTAYDVLFDEPSVPIKYNGGPVDIEKLIAIHTMDYESGAAYKSYTLEEFLAKYPGYHFEYAEVEYTIGNNVTREDAYAILEGSMITPAYVKSAGGKYTSIAIPKDDESIEGISAVGKKPMVLVTLVNDETKIVHAYGWFRFVIVKDIKEPRTFVLPDLPKVPFICGDFELAISWHEFSFFVLEAMGVEYSQFLKNYDFDGIWGYYSDGEFAQIDVADSDDPNVRYIQFEDKDWGTATYYVDANGSAINDVFVWDVEPQGLGEDSVQSIWWRFSDDEDIVYFKMTAEVAHRAKMDFVSNKDDRYWFTDVNGEDNNTVRQHVPVPAEDAPGDVSGGDVMKFQRDINHNFVGSKPILALDAAASDAVYANFFNTKNGKDPDAGANKKLYDDGELYTITDFYFADEQPVINKNILYTNYWAPYTFTDPATGETVTADVSKLLFVATLKSGKVKTEPFQVDPDDPDSVIQVPVISDDNLLAYFMDRAWDETKTDAFGGPLATDTLKYLATKKSKELLNLWSYTETETSKMLYANVLAKSTYGACEIELPDGLFYVRFIRPLDVKFDDLDVADESAVSGWNVELVKAISAITDWNKQQVIEKEMVPDPLPMNPNNKKWSGYYVAHWDNGVNMYEYYGFSSLSIDFQATEVNGWNVNNNAEWGKLADIADWTKLRIGTVEEATDPNGNTYNRFVPFENPANPYVVDITDFTNLRNIYINYKNEEGFADKFDMRIPVEITYAWGTIKTQLIIHVKNTGETNPN